MATIVISEATKAYADELVREGLYPSVDQAVEAALMRLRHCWGDAAVEVERLSPDIREAIEQSRAEAAAGLAIDLDVAFGELAARYASQ